MLEQVIMLQSFREHTSQEHNVTVGLKIPPWKGCSVGHPYFVTKLYWFLGSVVFILSFGA